MINSESKIKLHLSPFKWIEMQETFTAPDSRGLSVSYPNDNYRTIQASTAERQYSYDARSLVSIDGKIKNEENLSSFWKRFGAYLLSPEYRKFIKDVSGIDVVDLAFEANVYKYSKDSFMDAHSDLDTKVLTHVFYFNLEWNPQDGGCLSILNSKNEQDVAQRITPISGNSIMIIRADNSWHSVDKTICDKSRRSVTVTFYKKGSTSPMWVEGENYNLHNNNI